MKNLKILSFPIDKNYHLVKKNKKIPIIISLLEKENPDIIAFQQLRLPIRDEILNSLKDYNAWAEARGCRKQEHFNTILVKKNRNVTFSRLHSLGEELGLPSSKAIHAWSTKTCNTVVLDFEGEKLTIFNTEFDSFSKKARYEELSYLQNILDLSFYQGKKIIVGNFHMDMNEAFLSFLKKNNLRNATIHLGTTKIGKEGNANSHILVSSDLPFLESEKIMASKNNVFASSNFALKTKIIDQKKKRY